MTGGEWLALLFLLLAVAMFGVWGWLYNKLLTWRQQLESWERDLHHRETLIVKLQQWKEMKCHVKR
ncbi:hypothetical protein [Grimontia sp. NTOU-MAR1]|uniref:hypothetical protein n=1 Tax=Grimontia sp. NTOU-MAR1 TaxID=3111011 RepID=UPI002DB72209|nr:hypothetical protein [Grimontia sp. NTOU-MAR1]WRV98269.1 hypothetical protein VP504_02190 [Grimontia sp. NTOU-MAR1]